MAYFLAVNSPETIDLGFVKLGWFKVLILGIAQFAHAGFSRYWGGLYRDVVITRLS